MSDTTMPIAFLGHGNPMNALQRNRYTEAWRIFGESVPRPRAILVISAHWYTNATAVTAMPRPRTIHDFYGFPKSSFDVQYPAPGAPELAEQVAEVCKPTWVGQRHRQLGNRPRHLVGARSMPSPTADIPVVQLSLNAFKRLDHHLELGRRLAPLRDAGMLIVGSGNIVHNLRSRRLPQGGRGVRLGGAVRRSGSRGPRRYARRGGGARRPRGLQQGGADA